MIGEHRWKERDPSRLASQVNRWSRLNPDAIPISCLFIANDSIYKSIPGLDCWDVYRNAMLWPGGNPIIAHPPCRLWSSLRHVSNAPKREKWLGVFAIDEVRKWGGIVEHPARSTLWEYRRLPKPRKQDEWGFTLAVNQFHFGHLCRKATWLYIVGIDRRSLPEIPFVEGWPKYSIRGAKNSKKKALTETKYTNATPLKFAYWLVETAHMIAGRNYESASSL